MSLKNTVVPGVPYAKLTWDDSYTYYFNPAGFKVTGYDLISRCLQGKIANDKQTAAGTVNKKDKVLVSNPGNRIIYNEAVAGLQICPEIKAQDTIIAPPVITNIFTLKIGSTTKSLTGSVGDVIEPIDNKVVDANGLVMLMKDADNKDIPIPAFHTNKIAGNLCVGELSNSSSFIIGKDKLPRIYCATGNDCTFAVAFKLFDSPAEVVTQFKTVKDGITTLAPSSIMDPAFYVYFKVKRIADPLFDTKETDFAFVVEYSKNRKVNLYRLGERTGKDINGKDVVIQGETDFTEGVVLADGTTKKNLFSSPETFSIRQDYLVSSTIFPGAGYVTNEKEYTTLLFQILDNTLVINQLPQPELIWETGLSYHLIAEDEIGTYDNRTSTLNGSAKVKTDVIGSFFFPLRENRNLILGSRFGSFSYYINKVTYPSSSEDFITGYYNVPLYNGSLPTGDESLESCWLDSGIKKANLEVKPVGEDSLISFALNLKSLEISGGDNTITPIFRGKIWRHYEQSITPIRPTWWKADVLNPTSVTGEMSWKEINLSLSFAIPANLSSYDQPSTSLTDERETLMGLNGVYPTVLEFGRMDSTTGVVIQSQTIKGFFGDSQDRNRGKVLSTTSFPFVDRSYLLKNSIVANMPYYDGWLDIDAILDLVWQAGFISKANISVHRSNWLNTAESNNRLSVGTKDGPLWDFKAGGSFWDCIVKILGHYGTWFYIDNNGYPAYHSPLKWWKSVLNNVEVGDAGLILFKENSTDWAEEILDMTISDSYQAKCNLYSVFGMSPIYDVNGDIVADISPLAARVPATEGEMVSAITYPETENAYFPFKKVFQRQDPNLNNFSVLQRLADKEAALSFMSDSKVNLSVWGNTLIVPRSAIIVEETDEPKIIKLRKDSGGVAGIGYFIITSVGLNLNTNVGAINFSMTVQADRWYNNDLFWFSAAEFYQGV